MSDFHVNSKVTILRRSIIAKLTFKWFITQMDPDVSSHSSRVVRVILTKQTNVQIRSVQPRYK